MLLRTTSRLCSRHHTELRQDDVQSSGHLIIDIEEWHLFTRDIYISMQVASDLILCNIHQILHNHSLPKFKLEITRYCILVLSVVHTCVNALQTCIGQSPINIGHLIRCNRLNLTMKAWWKSRQRRSSSSMIKHQEQHWTALLWLLTQHSTDTPAIWARRRRWRIRCIIVFAWHYRDHQWSIRYENQHKSSIRRRLIGCTVAYRPRWSHLTWQFRDCHNENVASL